MKITSPLSDLCLVLAQIQTSAANYQATLISNEAATRAVLVDPILKGLGWDTANTFMVEVEKVERNTRLDYALKDMNGLVQVIVEAKPLKSQLLQPSVLQTILSYAVNFTPHGQAQPHIFLTDGLTWHHFTNMGPGRLTPDNSIYIGQTDPVECAAYLVQSLDAARFWQDNGTVDKLTQQVAQLTSDLSSLRQIITTLTKSSPSVTPPAVMMQLPPASPPVSPYVDLSARINVRGTKPQKLRLPDNSEADIQSWKDLLSECCKYALSHATNIPVPFKDRSGRSVNLIDSTPPAVGIAHLREQYNGQTIYIYTHYDANNCLQNALHILTLVPQQKMAVPPAVVYS